MTVATKTDYLVTFHWVAEDWKDQADDINNPPECTSESVTVTLPSDASPWDVYGEADALDKGPGGDSDVYSWDADGMTIEFDDKSLFLSGYLIKPETKWSDFS